MSIRQDRVFQVLYDQTRPVEERIDAAETLGVIGNAQTVRGLRDFLQRQLPVAKDYENNDPLVAERLCDIAVIEALHRLGDDSEWQYLLNAIAEAGSGIGQRIRETHFAAETITRIASTELIGQLVDVTSSDKPQAVANAVATLVALNLPAPPTHQSLASISLFAETIEVAPLTLVEYFKDVIDASKGRLDISAEAKAKLERKNYQIAEGKPEMTTLANVLSRDLQLYGLEYYLQEQKAVICTYAEAAQRWRDWWRKYGDQLMYQEEQSRFVLKGER
jgi:hypothetical protein